MSELDQVQLALGFRFKNRALLRLALTHPSVTQEQGVKLPNTNQRLEFLGDSVLSLVLTAELYCRHPEWEEGALTEARARLVNQRFLAGRARRLGLGPYLILSRSEEATGGRDRTSNLANTLEALIGAMYLDGGLEAVRAFVLRVFEPDLSSGPTGADLDNPKGRLQERLQAASAQSPVYQLTSVTGPDHDRRYECAVFHEGRELGRGTGRSKKEAEVAAALQALERLEHNLHNPTEAGGRARGPGRKGFSSRS